MAKRKVKDLLMISVEKAAQLYLSTLVTEGKSPRYIDWLKTRLKYFTDYLTDTGHPEMKLQELTVEEGREYLRFLMEKKTRYSNHPLHKESHGKLKIQYVHGLGRAVRSFSTWGYEEGYLDENVMRRLKLPKLPTTFPEPLTQEEVERVLAASLDTTLERLRNFSIMMLFFDCGLRLDELVDLHLSRIDFTIGDMTIFGKGSKERKVPVGLQAKKALLDYIARERPDPINPSDEDRVYLTADGYPLTHNSVEKILQRLKKTADVPRLHPHICRHTFAVRYLIHGGDAFSLQ